LNRYEMFCLFR